MINNDQCLTSKKKQINNDQRGTKISSNRPCLSGPMYFLTGSKQRDDSEQNILRAE